MIYYQTYWYFYVSICYIIKLLCWLFCDWTISWIQICFLQKRKKARPHQCFCASKWARLWGRLSFPSQLWWINNIIKDESNRNTGLLSLEKGMFKVFVKCFLDPFQSLYECVCFQKPSDHFSKCMLLLLKSSKINLNNSHLSLKKKW